MRTWSPEEFAAFLSGPVASAITESVNREAIEAGLTEVDNGQKLRIVAKDIIDTSATLDSVGHKVTKATAQGGEGESGPGTDYAIYHEFGTVKMAARPYMRPTVDEDQPIIGRAVMAVWWSAVRRVFS